MYIFSIDWNIFQKDDLINSVRLRSTNGETKIDKPCPKHCRSLFFCFGFSIIEFAYRISKRCMCVCVFSYSHKIRIRIK